MFGRKEVCAMCGGKLPLVGTVKKSCVGSAVVGGLLFGGVGLVAGGLMGHKTIETITKMSIVLKTTNKWTPEV